MAKPYMATLKFIIFSQINNFTHHDFVLILNFLKDSPVTLSNLIAQINNFTLKNASFLWIESQGISLIKHTTIKAVFLKIGAKKWYGGIFYKIFRLLVSCDKKGFNITWFRTHFAQIYVGSYFCDSVRSFLYSPCFSFLL